MLPGNQSDFKVTLTGKAKSALAGVVSIAHQHRAYAALRTAAEEIEQRLQSDPMSFGEPHYRLKITGVFVRSGVIRPLAVYYGVDLQRRIVYVHDFRLLLPTEPGRS
jgi:hypothetical protein